MLVEVVRVRIFPGRGYINSGLIRFVASCVTLYTYLLIV